MRKKDVTSASLHFSAPEFILFKLLLFMPVKKENTLFPPPTVCITVTFASTVFLYVIKELGKSFF